MTKGALDQLAAARIARATKPRETPASPLTETERLKLGDLELVIARGQVTFVKVGTALAQIREQRLYRADFPTFEAYCQERWGWGARRAGQVITSAEVVRSLGESEEKFPVVKESHAVEIGRVAPQKRAEVLERAKRRAKKPGRPTAKEIRREAESIVDEQATVVQEPSEDGREDRATASAPGGVIPPASDGLEWTLGSWDGLATLVVHRDGRHVLVAAEPTDPFTSWVLDALNAYESASRLPASGATRTA